MPSKNAHVKPVIASTPPDFGSQQVHFDAKSFNDFITDKSVGSSTIERALRCPCRVEGAGNALADCCNCGGTGWFFIDKITTALACVSMSNMSKFVPWTEQNMGTVSVTYRPQDKLGFMDRITLLELQSWYSDTRKVFLNKAGNALFFFNTYFPIDVFYMYIFNGVGNPLIYVTPDKYTISNNKITIDFATFKPQYDANEGSLSITLLYTHNPAFHVLDINRDLIKHFNDSNPAVSNLPLHAIARKAHFVFEQPDFSGNSLYDNTNYEIPPPNVNV